jgi:hypothetical protein
VTMDLGDLPASLVACGPVQPLGGTIT